MLFLAQTSERERGKSLSHNGSMTVTL